MAIHDVERQLDQLSRDEKARVFQRLALDLVQGWPSVEKTSGVQGGDAYIVRTRIPVWTLESYRRLGWDDERILANFPTLRQADLVYAWLYAEANQVEIEEAIREQEAACEAQDHLVESRLPERTPQGAATAEELRARFAEWDKESCAEPSSDEDDATYDAMLARLNGDAA